MEFSAEQIAPKLRELAKQNIYLGTSSWKYPGWIGQVYKRDYSGPRSAVNKKRFETECLAEYAEIFPTVCLDEAYWRFPNPESLAKYAKLVPDDFKFALKVTKFITERRDYQGKWNADFLQPALYTQQFWEPVKQALGDKLGPIIFEFSPFFFDRSQDYSPLQFIKDYHAFFSSIPKQGAELAIEIRDPKLLTIPKYFEGLKYHKLAHTFNEQTWMPELKEQLQVPGVFSTEFSVFRALVRPDVKHNEAVEEFEPYDRTQLELPELREGIAELVKMILGMKRKLYGYVNNRTEGNAPNTISAVLAMLET
jgi:uncharacterized protein YecE (DUF72 family)